MREWARWQFFCDAAGPRFLLISGQWSGYATAMKREPCRCGHPKSIHYPQRLSTKKIKRTPCRLDGCKCKDYNPVKTAN
jgi:hypothetical protein